MAGVIVAIVGTVAAIAVAIVVPIWIESLKRPSFVFSIAPNSLRDSDTVKYLHVRIVNPPITGRLARWLVRSTATNCIASATFEDLPLSGAKPRVPDAAARWSSNPEPWTMLLRPDGAAVRRYDETKLERIFHVDLSPSDNGEVIVVAMKHRGEPEAWAHSKRSWEEAAETGQQTASLELPVGEYKLTVRVHSGGVSDSKEFRVSNRDETLSGFTIDQWMTPPRAVLEDDS